MQKYEVEVSFIDGNVIVIEVEAENEDEAIQKAMPTNLQIW